MDSWTDHRLRAYTGERTELLPLVPGLHGPVLDVGCSSGAFGRMLKRERGPGTVVWGIESDGQLAAEAVTVLDEVLNVDAVDGVVTLRERCQSFSLLVFADVLEHVAQPWSLLDQAVALIPDGGHVLVSLPNVAHLDTFWNLLRGRWPHRDRGIHDISHLRFFGRRDVEELMSRPPLRLLKLERKFRIVEHSHPLNRFAGMVGHLWPNGFTFQFLALARVERHQPPR